MNKLLLTYILTIGISAAAGVGTGIVLKKTIGPIDEMYPPGFDPAEFSPDMDDIMSRYSKLSDKSINGMRGFSDAEVVNVVMQKYRDCEYSYSVSIGNANTIVTQTIRNAQIRYGNDFFEEQLSYSSMVAVATRAYQTNVDGEIKLYQGSPSSPEAASYPGNSTSYSPQDYKGYLGKTLDEVFIYVISDKTTVSSSKSTKGDETSIKMQLNPNLSTFYYKAQMKNISGLSNLPPFSEVNLTFTFKNDLSLKHLSIDETFTATKEGIPVPAKTNNVIEISYHPGEKLKIPGLNEAFNYKI